MHKVKGEASKQKGWSEPMCSLEHSCESREVKQAKPLTSPFPEYPTFHFRLFMLRFSTPVDYAI